MRKNYERKIFDSKALDVDTTTRQVKIAFAKVDEWDRDEETFIPSTFTKSIKENGPQGSNEIWHLLDHNKSSFSALSKFTEVGMDGQYLYGVSKYKDSFAWREVAWPMYEAGDFTQHSIGFTTVNDEKDKDGKRIIKEARIWEGSAVLWGANPNTPILQLLKTEFSEEDIEEEDLLALRIDKVIKKIKNDRVNDGNKSLLLIELMQIQDSLLTGNTKTTKPDTHLSTLPDATEANEIQLKLAIETMKLKLAS